MNIDEAKEKLDVINVLSIEPHPAIHKLYAEINDSKVGNILMVLHALYERYISEFDGRVNQAQVHKKNFYFDAENSKQFSRVMDNTQKIINGINKSFDIKMCTKLESFIANQGREISRNGGTTLFIRPELSDIDFSKSFFTLQEPRLLTKKSVTFEEKVIGDGSFATVSKYKDHDYDKFFAIKRLKKTRTAEYRDRFKEEFNVMKSLWHPNIIKVYKAFDLDGSRPSFNMDYVNTNLFDYINKNNATTNVDLRAVLAYQLLDALEYMHSKNVLHRDLSEKNLLIDSLHGQPSLFIADFGIAKSDEIKTLTKESVKGTHIDPTLRSFRDYSLENEIYQIGIMLNFIFFGKTHQDDTKAPEFIKKCWTTDLSRRTKTIKDIRQGMNLWIQGQQNGELLFDVW